MNWIKWLLVLFGLVMVGFAVSPIVHALTINYSTTTVTANQPTIIDANIFCDKYDNYLSQGDIVQTSFFFCQGTNCKEITSQNFVYSVPCNKSIQFGLTAPPDTNSSIVLMAKRYGDNQYPIQKIVFLKLKEQPTGQATIVPTKSNKIKTETIIGVIIIAIGLFCTLLIKKWWGILILLIGMIIFAFTLW